MKKVYCFHCQTDVEPKKIWHLRICPHCLHKITDTGKGLYLVCNKCGANMPVDAKYCPKCGKGAMGNPDVDIRDMYQDRMFNNRILFAKTSPATFVDWIIRALLLIISIMIAIGVMYVSIYLIGAFFVLGVAYLIYNNIRRMM